MDVNSLLKKESRPAFNDIVVLIEDVQLYALDYDKYGVKQLCMNNLYMNVVYGFGKKSLRDNEYGDVCCHMFRRDSL